MVPLKARFKVWADRVDAMSVRERGLVFFAVIVVLYLIAQNVVFGPLRAEQGRFENEIKAKREQVRNVDNQISALVAGVPIDADARNRAKLAALTRQLQELDAHMDRMTVGMVSPQEMAKLIEQMLSRNKKLALVKLEALAAKPIEPAPTGAGAEKPPEAAVYRHGMRVVLQGRYFDIVEYLKALEQLPWKVFWGEVSLETDKYPISSVSFVVYTLSRNPGWIGV